MLNMGPCAMLPPHWHPHATNYVVAVEGSTTTYMFEENGGQLYVETLMPGKATIFPRGSMHMMHNNGQSCPFSPVSCCLSGNVAWTGLTTPIQAARTPS